MNPMFLSKMFGGVAFFEALHGAGGLIQAACVDGTDLPAWSSRDPHDTRRGLGAPGHTALYQRLNPRLPALRP